MMTTRITRLAVDGGDLREERIGDGPPVVLLHGGYLTAAAWDHQVADLAAAYTLIRYDARSQGRSSTAAADVNPADDLLAVLDAFGLEWAVLIGNSMGGVTAFDCALAHPERVAALISAGGGISPMSFDDEQFVLAQQAVQAEPIQSWGGEAYVEAFLRYGADGPHRAPGQTPLDVRERCRAMAKSTIQAHATATGVMLTGDSRPRLSEIVAPTLFLIGDLDLRTLHRLADEAVASMPHARKLILAGGHALNMERPVEFNRAVLGFLDDVLSA